MAGEVLNKIIVNNPTGEVMSAIRDIFSGGTFNYSKVADRVTCQSAETKEIMDTACEFCMLTSIDNLFIGSEDLTGLITFYTHNINAYSLVLALAKAVPDADITFVWDLLQFSGYDTGMIKLHKGDVYDSFTPFIGTPEALWFSYIVTEGLCEWDQYLGALDKLINAGAQGIEPISKDNKYYTYLLNKEYGEEVLIHA